MSLAWQILVVALWAFVLAQAVLILSLYRQFGEIYLGTREARSRDGLPLRSKAPVWTATDQVGRTVSSADFAGAPLLVAFAEPTCTPCKKMMPELREFAAATPNL